MFLLAHIAGRKSKFGKKEINQVDADCILEERDYVSRIQINVKLHYIPISHVMFIYIQNRPSIVILIHILDIEIRGGLNQNI